MGKLVVKFKKLRDDAGAPTRAHDTDAGFDLYASHEEESYFIHKGKIACIPTGIAVQIPEGYFGMLCLRSSMAAKRSYSIPNGVGIIDSAYRGEIKMLLQYNGSGSYDSILAGERIGQLIILPLQDLSYSLVEELEDSDRGIGGFGSTGK